VHEGLRERAQEGDLDIAALMASRGPKPR